ncbi:MAG: hypothetical protein RR436_06020 [Clostridia bacterium]
MFKIECEKPIISKCKSMYKGIAFDGVNIYLTVPCEQKIVKLDMNFNVICIIDTIKSYTYLCYDPQRCCFWAATDKCLPVIYCLDMCLLEIDEIKICNQTSLGGIVSGLSFDCNDGSILVSIANSIVRVNPECSKKNCLFLTLPCKFLCGVLSISPYVFCNYITKETQNIAVYDCKKNLIYDAFIPCDVMVESAVFVPCKNGCYKNHIYVLVTKKGQYPYILDCIIKCDLLPLGFNNCNYNVCNDNCHKKPCHRNVCADVLESVALVETALSHILNAEGEKLQKVIESTTDVCKILETNCSITKTIEKATHLECILYDKISLVKDICCFCDKD